MHDRSTDAVAPGADGLVGRTTPSTELRDCYRIAVLLRARYLTAGVQDRRAGERLGGRERGDAP